MKKGSASGTRKREPWNPLLKSYPFSEKINAISIGAETLFTRLIAQADDYGNYYGSPRLLLASLFPHRWAKKEMSETDAGRWRAELVTCTAGPLAALYYVNGKEYLHLIEPRRRLRNDVLPDKRFPREPANLEEKALSEYVTKAARKRTVNGPLDPDQDKTRPIKEKAKEKEMQRSENSLPESPKRQSLKGRTLNEVISIYENNPLAPPEGLSRPQVLAAVLDHAEGFASIVEELGWSKIMIRLGQLFNDSHTIQLEYRDLVGCAIGFKQIPSPAGKKASLNYLIGALTGQAQAKRAKRLEDEAQNRKKISKGDDLVTDLAQKIREENDTTPQ